MMTLSEIEKLLFLDVHDTLGDVEGAKCHPKLLPREAVILGL
jgi:RNase P/RNase MRP subunit POP5